MSPETFPDYKTCAVADLIPYARNARTHSDEQVLQIAASIREFGFTNPVLIDGQRGIIAGHGRVMAAKKLGLQAVPVIELSHLTETQRKAYILADNKLALNAGWDNELLKLELEELKLEDFDLGLTGFNPDELGALFTTQEEGLTDPDATPEVQEQPITKLGDVWVMGRHRLLCGDSTDINSVEKMMGGAKADFCFTSPPYNAATSINIEGEGKSLYLNNKTDDRTSDEYIKFNSDIFSAMLVISNENFTCCYNINYNKKSPSEYIDIVYVAKNILPLRETIAWEKTMAISLHGSNMTRIFEFVFVFSKGKFLVNKAQTDCLKNLWKISNVGANSDNHKACFPVALPEQGIRYFAPHGAVVYEPFCGTGTTLIAAEKTGCQARLMELDPRYADVTIRRWQNFTGQQAKLEGDGRTFAEIESENKHE